MSFIQLSTYGNTPFERLLGHKPDLLEQWEKLELTFFQSQTFDAHFLEQIRRALAFNIQCQYCMAKAGEPDQNPEDSRLIEALRFANTFAISHEHIDENEIARLKNYFSVREFDFSAQYYFAVSREESLEMRLVKPHYFDGTRFILKNRAG